MSLFCECRSLPLSRECLCMANVSLCLASGDVYCGNPPPGDVSLLGDVPLTGMYLYWECLSIVSASLVVGTSLYCGYFSIGSVSLWMSLYCGGLPSGTVSLLWLSLYGACLSLANISLYCKCLHGFLLVLLRLRSTRRTVVRV